MVGMNAGVVRPSSLDEPQKSVMAITNNSSRIQAALRSKNLEMLGKLLRKVRLVVMGAWMKRTYQQWRMSIGSSRRSIVTIRPEKR